MQITKLFTVYDSKAEAYMNPFHARSTGEAVRMFEQGLQDDNSALSSSPADFTLFELGQWNDSDASIVMLDAKLPLANGNDLLKANVVALNDKQKKKA
jgi:hypothetical protein